jgi:hypothetical protein
MRDREIHAQRRGHCVLEGSTSQVHPRLLAEGDARPGSRSSAANPCSVQELS